MRNVLEGLNEKFLQARKVLARGEFVLLFDGADREMTWKDELVCS